MRPPKPQIGKAPGLVWRPRKLLWEARWQARSDLAKRGYKIKSICIWIGAQPDPTEAAYIRSRCDVQQAEMLAWSRGGDSIYVPPDFYDGSLHSLIGVYQTDQDSPFRKLQYVTRNARVGDLRRLDKEHGECRIAEMRPRDVLRWHEKWADGGKIASAHAKVTLLRTLLSFGASIIECEHCDRLFTKLHHIKFKTSHARDVHLTAEQAIAIRAEAHRVGFPSIAKAQALQFDFMLRQKDVIGAWEPLAEPGAPSEIIHNDRKWRRGLRGEEIDQNLVLKHVTSKRGKLLVMPLSLAPMVMEEFKDGFPAKGPLIICEKTGRPWSSSSFSKKWREIADTCGVPKHVRNMDSRAGGASEATDAGVDLEPLRHAMTHSDIKTTAGYSRSAAEKTANVLIRRVEFRNKGK